MIDALKPYPEYTDTGEPWLGAAPSHWQMRRAKYILREIDNRWAEKTGTLLSVSQYTGVTKRRLREGSDEPATRSATLEGYKVIAVNDLAVNIMLAWNGSLGVSPFDGVVSPAYCVYRFRSGDPQFFHHLLRSPNYRSEIKRRSHGVVESRLRLYSDDLFRMPLLVPPPAEQAAIVRFLGAVDRKVNRFIRAKRRLIEVLTEQKQAIITHAVTKGLNPHAPLRPSGIDWIGDVPEHWEVVRNKTVCRLGTGHTPSRSEAGYWVNCTVPWITLADVHQFRKDQILRIHETTEMVSELGLANSAAVKLPRGTVILSRTASVGFSVVLGREMATSQDFMAWTPGARVISEYLLFVLRGMRGELRRIMYGSTHNTIYMPSLHGLFMPLPPVPEQQHIAEYLEVQTGAVLSAISQVERQIDMIREYRTRLVADVVTGKLDVRAAAAGIPDDDAAPDAGAADDPPGEGESAEGEDDDALAPALGGAENGEDDA